MSDVDWDLSIVRQSTLAVCTHPVDRCSCRIVRRYPGLAMEGFRVPTPGQTTCLKSTVGESHRPGRIEVLEQVLEVSQSTRQCDLTVPSGIFSRLAIS